MALRSTKAAHTLDGLGYDVQPRYSVYEAKTLAETPINLQALLDGMSAQWQRKRAETQMTLGKIIATLEALPGDRLIDGICSPHSYRGYYIDLAFEPSAAKITAADALRMCRSVMGQVLEGYKGGDFVMGALTPVWLAKYGRTGKKIIGITQDGSFQTVEDEVL